MINTILLDVDGVLANFHLAALKAHNSISLAEQWPEGVWDMAKVMGISENKFWEPIDTYRFWKNVPPYDGAIEFYHQLRQIADVVISTSPSMCAGCSKAKVEWIRKYLGKDVKFMLGAHKHLMARPDALLIDDYDKNHSRFIAAGGHSILFPRAWNTAHSFADAAGSDIYMHVLESVRMLSSQVSSAADAGSILTEAQQLTTCTRQGTYGHPLDDFSRTALIWSGILRDLLRPDTIIPAERVPLCMTGVKISREINHPKRDNRVDGAGYWNTLQLLVEEKDRRAKELRISKEIV